MANAIEHTRDYFNALQAFKADHSDVRFNSIPESNNGWLVCTYSAHFDNLCDESVLSQANHEVIMESLSDYKDSFEVISYSGSHGLVCYYAVKADSKAHQELAQMMIDLEDYPLLDDMKVDTCPNCERSILTDDLDNVSTAEGLYCSTECCEEHEGTDDSDD
jgi:hypothetical protein